VARRSEGTERPISRYRGTCLDSLVRHLRRNAQYNLLKCDSGILGQRTVLSHGRHQTVQTVRSRDLEPSLLIMKSALNPRLR
jgi:hypothetical protein